MAIWIILIKIFLAQVQRNLTVLKVLMKLSMAFNYCA